MKIPICNIEKFREHLSNTNINFPIKDEGIVGEIAKVTKNLVLAIPSDSSGCGHIRCIFPLTYLNSVFGKSGRFNTIIAPQSMIFQHDVLMRTRSIFLQRVMSPVQINTVKQYKQLQTKYSYKLVWECDDFIWSGNEEGECIPAYNFGGYSIGNDVKQAALDIANLADIITVSTDFLGKYIKNRGVTVPFVTIPNTISQFFWGNKKKKPIKDRIIKPKVVYTGSPTHYYNEKQLKGDWENAWLEWVIKNVKENKIDFLCMGGLPFFFEEIKNKIKILSWVNSFQYHLPIINFKPDFGIAPLVPNFFNYSKSDIKHIEYCAVGALSIGTVFDNVKSPSCWEGNHAPSPYDNVFLKVQHDCTVKDIDDLFWEHTCPEKYNDILQKQYNFLYNEGRYLESDIALKRYTDVL